MAGERTPDFGANARGGSTDDLISLREHMQRQVDAAANTARQEHLRVQEYFNQRLNDLRDLLDERFRAQQSAVDELKTTTAQRFESVNEFRAQLNDQAQRFMGRDESVSRHERNSETLAAMGLRHENEFRLMRERFDTELKGLRDRHETDMGLVNSRLDLSAGKGAGFEKGWGFLVGAAGFIATILAIVYALSR